MTWFPQIHHLLPKEIPLHLPSKDVSIYTEAVPSHTSGNNLYTFTLDPSLFSRFQRNLPSSLETPGQSYSTWNYQHQRWLPYRKINTFLKQLLEHTNVMDSFADMVQVRQWEPSPLYLFPAVRKRREESKNNKSWLQLWATTKRRCCSNDENCWTCYKV